MAYDTANSYARPRRRRRKRKSHYGVLVLVIVLLIALIALISDLLLGHLEKKLKKRRMN